MKMNEFCFHFIHFFHLKTTLNNRYDFFFVFCVAVFVVAVKVDDGSTKEEDKEDDV
jgi:heme/copper-type cytochrome/quinol oxidase subunit 4